MKFLAALPWLIIGLLAVVSAVLIIKQVKIKKSINQLSDNINEFVNTGSKTEFSVYDNYFAGLQNGVADLQEIICFEHSRLVQENKKNTKFISDISHQLKTPIAALRLYCEMDKEMNASPHSEKELQLVDKMEKLVYQLLRLEKIKVDSYVMSYKFVKAEDVVNKVFAEFRPLFPEKKMLVQGNSVIRCDETWLGEALGNIVKNACEHTADDGVVTVEISENRHSTIIEIGDNGGGIAEEEIPNLFTRFYKAENSSPNSTGIGLAITKAVVEKHHGIISVENKNNGLYFSICLPHIDGYETI